MHEGPSSHLCELAEGRLDTATGQRSVFALRDISPGEVIAVFGGSIVDAAQLAALGPGVGNYTIQVDEELYLVSTSDGPGDWINHACDPNAGFRGQITLVAMRSIARGEEICFDYAMADGSPYDEFACGCGSLRCRGRVTGDDWKDTRLWARYAGYFSAYLARRIAMLEAAREEFRSAAPRRMVRRVAGRPRA